MTVIAFDGRTMAADSMLHQAGTRATVQKVFRIDGALVGWCGAAVGAFALIEWGRRGWRARSFPAAVLARCEDDGPMLMRVSARGVELLETAAVWQPLADRYFAIGSGGDIALGAMSHGATAIEAVGYACERTVTCGRPVQWLELQ